MSTGTGLTSPSSSRELPTDRLATTDEKGRRIYLYPADVRGFFRVWRNAVHSVLILIFLVLPWIEINGRQAILLDIAHRRFTIFGVTFWAHDAPMLVFVFGGTALLLAFVTAIWGRVWCGWACPQTVFIDSVYRRIERWLEGDAVTRRIADQKPLDADRFFRKAFKWLAFLIVSLLLTHSFLAYFIDVQTLAKIVRQSPAENPVAFTFMLATTGLILFDFGWFREQFCTIACPYGRFQSVLMDDHSLLVAYDSKRGEPRKGTAASGSQGDCVNCYRCVQVCPTGVDIRRGMQLECIACTACIDACDEVMERTGRPKGLIRYDTFAGLKNEKSRKLRPRTLVYLVLLTIIGVGLGVSLAFHEPLQANFLRAVDSPYEEIHSADGPARVVNRFKLDLANQMFEDKQVQVALAASRNDSGIQMVMPVSPLTVPAGKAVKSDLFVTFPRDLLRSGRATVQVRLLWSGQGDGGTLEKTEEVTLVGPFF